MKMINKIVLCSLVTTSILSPAFAKAETFISNDGLDDPQDIFSATSGLDVEPTNPTVSSTPGTAPVSVTTVPTMGPNGSEAINSTESILGSDSRTKVSNMGVTPYKSVVYLFQTFPSGKSYRCSGTMVSADTVLTAAHCLYSKVDGGWATKVEAFAGMHGTTVDIGKATSEKLYILKGWTSSTVPSNDMGAIKLNVDLGKKTGTLGLTSALSLNQSISTAGYPGDKGVEMYSSSGTVKSIQAETINHNMDTMGGQSGSGIWNSDKKLVAVHTNGSVDGNGTNSGTRLHSKNIDYIKSWIGTPVAHSFDKKVSISREGQSLWSNFEFNTAKSNTTGKLGKVYYYNHPNGYTYHSLYNEDGSWAGYSNANHQMVVEPVAFAKNVTITKPGYDLWSSFYFNTTKGISDTYLNKSLYAKYIYTLGNGRQYYSLYTSNGGTWLGYVNVNATK